MHLASLHEVKTHCHQVAEEASLALAPLPLLSETKSPLRARFSKTIYSETRRKRRLQLQINKIELTLLALSRRLPLEVSEEFVTHSTHRKVLSS